MCYVIVTSRSMLWTLLTIASTLTIIASVITPQWLIGRPRQGRQMYLGSNWTGIPEEDLHTYTPTVGIFNRCKNVHRFGDFRSDDCVTYVTGFSMPDELFPDPWKSCLIFLGLASVLLLVTNISALFSLCVQAVFKKSIFTISGLVQSIAGEVLVIILSFS